MLKEEFDISFYLLDSKGLDLNAIVDSDFKVVTIENDSIFFDVLTGNEIVVLDGYHFDTFYQKNVKEKGCALICIDDLHDKHFLADAIINHTPGLVKNTYSAEPYTSFLLGPDYALLRPGFVKQASRPGYPRKIQSVFICFGGSDFKNLTIRALQVVQKLSFLKSVTVVTGKVYPHFEKLSNLLTSESGRVTHLHNIDEQEMISCLLATDLAVVPSSGILFETISCKTPVVSGYYTSNQYDIYKGFLSLGAIYDAGEFEISKLTQALNGAILADNEKMISNQAKCIDGKSPLRYTEFFKRLAYADSGIG